MTIALGSDHAGYELKTAMKRHLEVTGHRVIDLGTNGPESVDYPDFAHVVAERVAGGEAALGVLVCGSGNGVSIAANKHKGVRSALAWRADVAALARTHNNANVLSVPARFVTQEEGLVILDAFLSASFEGGRHERRVEKIEPTH